MMPPIELHGAPLSELDTTLREVFNQNVLKYPDTVALVSTQQPSTLYGIPSQPPLDSAKHEAEYLRWTYRDLDRAVKQFAAGLQSRGLKKGDPLVLLIANTAEYVIATWAAYQIGCAYVPLNPKGLANPVEMRHMLQIARKGCQSDLLGVVAGTSDMCAQIEELTSDVNCVRIVVEGGDTRKGWTPFNELMLNPPSETLCRDDYPNLSSPDQTIFFTSGTTSLPKGCDMSSTYGFAAAQRWSQSDVPMRPGDRALFTLPNNHGFGWLCIIGPFLNAATVVLPGPRFSPEAVAKAIREEQVSHAGLVPTMLHALSNLPAASRKLSSLRRIVMGGSAPTEEVMRICLDTLGASGVENLYGMTEGILVSSGVVSEPSGIVKDGRVSIGTPLPGMTVRIYTKDNSKAPAVVGEIGEMHFTGPSLINGYVGKVDDNFYTADDGSPWFRTGDKAFIGADNRIYLVGRYKDTIIRGGENIEPSAIEAVLGQIPEIHLLQPQIVRAPDDVAGEVPVAVVNQEVDDYTTNRLKETVLERMGDIYVPAEVVPVQTLGHESYPTTMAGKVQKTKLEELVKVHWEKRRQYIQANCRIDGPISGPQVMQSLSMALEKEKGHPVNESVRMIELGVDSIMSITILKLVQIETGVSLPSSIFFTQATFGTICQQISEISDTADFADFTPAMEDPPIDQCFTVLIQGTPRPGVPSIFLTPPGSGNPLIYKTLPKFANDRAVYSFGSPFLMTKYETCWTVEQTAEIYTNTILNLDSQGPYILGGWSMGCATAYETAYRLQKEHGKQVLGIFMFDLSLPRKPAHIPELTVELFQMMGAFPPIRREGQPDVEVPMFRKRHRVAAYYAKMNYVPRPFTGPNRPRVFIVWAGRGDYERVTEMVVEATELLKREGPGTKMQVSQDWLQAPREIFDAGGWDEMVGADYVEWGVVKDGDHDSIIEDKELAVITQGYMENAIAKWVREAAITPNGSS